MFRQKNLGQSTAEYAIVIGLVIAAAVGMQIYVKRSLQAKIKGVVDYRGDSRFTTGQYEPDYSFSDMRTIRNAEETTETLEQGKVVRSLGEKGEVVTKSGKQITYGTK